MPRYVRSRDVFRERVERALVEAGATPPLRLTSRPFPRWLNFVDATGRHAMWSVHGRPYVERAEGPSVLSDAVHIRGPFRGWEGGDDYFTEEYPRRRVYPGGGHTCARCGADCDQWFTDSPLWNRLPERWRRKVLCVKCFVEMVPESK